MAIGTAVLDFGPRPSSTQAGQTVARTLVTGLTALTRATAMEAWLQGDVTSDHSADEHVAEHLEVRVSYVSATTMNITGIIRTGRAWGKYLVHYVTL